MYELLNMSSRAVKMLAPTNIHRYIQVIYLIDMHTHAPTHAHTHAHAPTHTHPPTHKHTHTHTHTCMHAHLTIQNDTVPMRTSLGQVVFDVGDLAEGNREEGHSVNARVKGQGMQTIYAHT